MRKRLTVAALTIGIVGMLLLPASSQAAPKVCMGTAHNFARYDGNFGFGKLFSATMDAVSWCRHNDRVTNVKVQLLHKIYKQLTVGAFVHFNGFDGTVQYPYNYHRKGNGSGYAIKTVAHFSGCEPTHNICLGDLQLYLRTYLHYDGSCTAYATATNALGKNSDALFATNCTRG